MKYQIRHCQGSSGCLLKEQYVDTLELALSFAIGEEDNITSWISEFSNARGEYVVKMVRRAAHHQPEGRGLKSIPPRLQFV